MEHYSVLKSDTERVKSALTDIAHYLAKTIWDECTNSNKGEGNLFFGIGGVNTVNPFSAKAIKFEPLFYCDKIPLDCARLGSANEGDIFDRAGKPCKLDLASYAELYMDFNGSMAAFSEGSFLQRQLKTALDRLKGVVVMGGVQADLPAKTMPAISGVLNRFSAATMNQLYHPPNTARFFRLLASRPTVPCLTVTNNVVADLTTFSDPARTVKTYDGVQRFLDANRIDSRTLRDISQHFYEDARLKPPRKAFDYYAAVALAHMVRAGAPPASARRTLFYSGDYGLTLVSSAGSWSEARAQYAAGIDARPAEGDDAFTKGKKESFGREVDAMSRLELEVGDVCALALAVRFWAGTPLHVSHKPRPLRPTPHSPTRPPTPRFAVGLTSRSTAAPYSTPSAHARFGWCAASLFCCAPCSARPVRQPAFRKRFRSIPPTLPSASRSPLHFPVAPPLMLLLTLCRHSRARRAQKLAVLDLAFRVGEDGRLEIVAPAPDPSRT
jgi:hypothetical protein